ncbi:hypothetical protein IV203_031147 [Nitzschia inconspicua]|uniref:Uncharacterized protein n=1 Tax=Nitzschia inconspicua TaxID=303405 RepID=A0A9K3LTQ2_9STRA|nr:hypothetical protein IV203_031147 [Nitzschia inconspicua]
MIIPHVGKMGCCMAALTSAATSKFGSCYPGFVSRTSTSVVFPSHIISGALQVRGGQAVEAALESRESLHHLVVNIRHLDSPRDERCFAVVDIHQILQRTKPLRLEFLYHFYNRLYDLYNTLRNDDKAHPDNVGMSRRVGTYIMAGSILLILLGSYHINSILNLATKLIFIDDYKYNFS